MNNNARPAPLPPSPTVRRRRAASTVTWPSDTRHDSTEGSARELTPHIPGDATCLCPTCHLKLSRFPRRQDGRIVLPDPLAVRMDPLGVSSGSSHLLATAARVRTRSNVHVDGGHFEEDRRAIVGRDMWDDRGEGPSVAGGGAYHSSRSGIPVTVLDGHPRTLDILQEFETPRSGEIPLPASATGGPTRNRQGSLSDRPRPRRVPKPYDPKLSAPSAVRHQGKPYSGPQDAPTAYEEFTSHQSSSGISQTATAHSSVSLTHTYSDAYHPVVHNAKVKAPKKATTTPAHSRPPSSHSTPYNNPSLATHTAHQHTINISTNINPYYTDAGNADKPAPKVIRFNSRPNPPPSMMVEEPQYNNNTEVKSPGTPPDMGYYEGEDNSGSSNSGAYKVLPTGLTAPARERTSSLGGPSSSTSHHRHPPQQQAQLQYPPQTTTFQQDYYSLQIQDAAPPLRFQNPVTPQIHIENSRAAGEGRSRSSSVVPVKWDSERKRRQGYFAAQDDGEEKSPFRHYNKTGCDYDS